MPPRDVRFLPLLMVFRLVRALWRGLGDLAKGLSTPSVKGGFVSLRNTLRDPYSGEAVLLTKRYLGWMR